VPGYASEAWYGHYGPAGTPRETIERLNAAANQAIRAETFQRQVAEEGLSIMGGPPARLADYVRAEETRWREVVQRANITAE
jgi:tripartite-type tricarboxylate transporter receptor subunit TctC